MAEALPPFVLRHLADIARSQGLADTCTIEHCPGSKNGDGFMSNLLAITLDCRVTDKRLALICKLQLPPPDSSDALDTGAVFDREVLMYQRVLPMMDALQQRAGLTPETGFFAYPRCYLAEKGESNDSIIVLEDLRSRGYALWDKRLPLLYENVQLLLQQLGRYHALSFVLRDQQPADFAGLNEFYDFSVRFCGESRMVTNMIGSSIEKAIGLVDSAQNKELLRRVRRDWVELVTSRQSEARLKQFGVLSHGDCFINNMMFKLNGSGTPESIVIIDWQAPSIVSPASDLTLFLLCCTEKPLRDQHYDQLLRVYHDELSAVIRSFHCDPEALFSYTDLSAQMREFGVNALIMAPLAVSMMITPPEEMKKMSDLSAAEDGDLDASVLAVLSERTEQLYKERLQDVIEDVRALGYVERFEGVE